MLKTTIRAVMIAALALPAMAVASDAKERAVLAYLAKEKCGANITDTELGLMVIASAAQSGFTSPDSVTSHARELGLTAEIIWASASASQREDACRAYFGASR